MTSQRFTEVVYEFLRYAFEDINFKYDDLTEREKAICSASEFEELRKMIDGRVQLRAA